jgi:glycosidase
MLVRWLRDYGLDGFRCDYAAGVPPTSGNRCARTRSRAAGPRVAGRSRRSGAARKAFDIDYAWDFYHAMSDALAGASPLACSPSVAACASRYPRGALRLRFSDNHDQLRTTGQAGLPAALAASAVMFTLDGVPLLYNGMEWVTPPKSAATGAVRAMPISWEMADVVRR